MNSIYVLGILLAMVLLAGLWMLPMQAVRLKLGELLAADTATLGPAVGNLLGVITAPFTESETLVVGDLTIASTHGLSPIVLATGASEVAIDPTTFAQVITLIPAAGPGFHWVTSGGFPPTITVYGYALTDTTGATLLGVVSLATPIQLTNDGQQLDANPQQMVFVLQPLS